MADGARQTENAADGPGTAVSRFWRIGGGFFRDRRRRLAQALVLVLVVLGIAQIGVQLLLNVWGGAVFDAIEQRDTTELMRQVVVFAGLAVAFLALSAYHLYGKMRLQVEWRIWITDHLVADWLAYGRRRELSLMGRDYDNPDQRIAEDVRLATEAAVDFADGIFHAVLMLFCFVGVLWSLSGTLTLPILPDMAIVVPGYLVWAAVAYAGVGTLFTYLLGRPLVRLNQDRLSHEADFRVGLVRVDEGGRGVAVSHGQDQDRRHLRESFAKVIATWRRLMLRTRRLTYMTSGYAIIATGFPVLIAAPPYFAHAITLGGLMQATAAFVTVQATLSWFVDNYSRFADWSASVHRISTFRDAIDKLIERDEYEEIANRAGGARPIVAGRIVAAVIGPLLPAERTGFRSGGQSHGQ